MSGVSVVIPARNEERNLEHVFSRIPRLVDEVILVDGHSTDRTVQEALRLRPDLVVVIQPGQGKGDALRAGFAAATREIVVMLDADGSTDPAEIPAFVDALLTGADLVKGSRSPRIGGGSSDITPLRSFGNRVLTAFVNVVFGSNFTDLCYGYAAFWRRTLLERVELDCDGFEIETLMNVRATAAGLRVAEVPSHECPRLHGESNLSVVRDGLRILRVLMTEPLRIRSRLRLSHRRTLPIQLQLKENTP